jgi:hypothetical protein
MDKNRNMKKIIFLSLMFFITIASTQTKITNNLGDFSTLKIYNGIELEMIKSEDQKIEISGEKTEKVKIKNVNGVLKISLLFPETFADGKVKVIVYYNKNIAVIDANEGATVTGDAIIQENLEVNTQERAFINLTVEVKNLKVRTSSGGIIKLTGSAATQEVDVDLYGVYNGFALQVIEKTTVKAGTGAKAELSPGKILSAKVNFGGSIFYKGDPEVIKDQKIIGGIIQKRN